MSIPQILQHPFITAYQAPNSDPDSIPTPPPPLSTNPSNRSNRQQQHTSSRQNTHKQKSKPKPSRGHRKTGKRSPSPCDSEASTEDEEVDLRTEPMVDTPAKRNMSGNQPSTNSIRLLVLQLLKLFFLPPFFFIFFLKLIRSLNAVLRAGTNKMCMTAISCFYLFLFQSSMFGTYSKSTA